MIYLQMEKTCLFSDFHIFVTYWYQSIFLRPSYIQQTAFNHIYSISENIILHSSYTQQMSLITITLISDKIYRH